MAKLALSGVPGMRLALVTVLALATGGLCFSPMSFLPSTACPPRTSSPAMRCKLPLAAHMKLSASSFNQGVSLPKLRVAPSVGTKRSSLPSLAAGKSVEEEDEEMEIMVRDPKNGKTIDCYVDEQMEFDGKSYVLVYPCDRPVVIARVEGEGDEEELMPVEDETLEKIYKLAYKACAEEDVELIDSAVVLTLQGEIDDDDEEEEEKLRNAMGEPTDEEEFVRVITSFNDDAGQEYLVTEPLEPVLIIAKPVAGEGKKSKPIYELLDDAELDEVMPSVDGFLQDRYVDED